MTKAIVMTLTMALALLLRECCGGSDSNRAQIRFVNISPGAESVNFSFADATAASAIAYHSASANQGVDAGSRHLRIVSRIARLHLGDCKVEWRAGLDAERVQVRQATSEEPWTTLADSMR